MTDAGAGLVLVDPAPVTDRDRQAGRCTRRQSPSTRRAKLRGLQRNAAVVLGDVRTPDDIPVLTPALGDAEPLVREHAA